MTAQTAGRLVIPAISLAAAVLLVALQPTVEAFLICLLALALVVPLGTRLVRGTADLFDPLVVTTLAFTVMYVGRPAAMIADPAPDMFKGYEITGQVREALLIALVAVVFFQIGYALPWAQRLALRIRPAPGRWAVDTTVAFAIGVGLLAVALFGLFLKQSGGVQFLLEMLKGRNAAHESLYRSSSAYLYGAPQLIWPVSLLLFATGLAVRRPVIVALSFVFLAALAVFAGGQGSRITLIPLLVAPAVYSYLSRGRRPAPLAVALASYLVLTVGIAYFRETRTATVQIDRAAELKHALFDPSFEVRELLLHGTDNDMFESLATATIVIPEKITPNPLDFAVRIIAKPIPSVLWKGKPGDPDERLNDTLFPGEQVRASSSTGIVGSFFLAGSFPGVAVGMLLLGVLIRLPWDYWRRYPDTSVAQLFLCATLLLIPAVLRGGLSDTIVRLIFALGPLFVAVRVCRIPDAAAKRDVPMAR